MSQLTMWIILLAALLIGPSAMFLGYRWYERRKRHGHHRRRT